MLSPLPSIVLAAALLQAPGAGAQEAAARYPQLPSETPASFQAPTAGLGYQRRTVAIPMRDGVKLNTVVLLPKGARNAPVLLTRTPYNAAEMAAMSASSDLETTLQGYDNPADLVVEGGYIRVLQDVRGKYGSEGDYVMTRPPRGPLNPTPVDHATDTWDTIAWLLNNLPESNGKVGLIGGSYDGFLPLMALLDPHPALKAVVPLNPMVDGWRGDDWFHNGAFRQANLPYLLEQVATRANEAKWYTSHYDDYEVYLRAGSAGALARERGLEQTGFWTKLSAHPAYDSFWQQQAVDKLLARAPVTVPTLLVHSLWDAEDIYGPLAVYKAVKPADKAGLVHLAIGPWNHGGMLEDGSSLGPLRFRSDTAWHFRQEVLRPFLDRYLKDGPPPPAIPAVSAFETGSNRWRALRDWPANPAEPVKLHLAANGLATLDTPPSGAAYDEYVSDPAKPVPYRARPIRPVGYDEAKGLSWPRWLVDDQREASGRTDVLTYTSAVLTAPLTIRGEPLVHLQASTSGTDSDWVVKLIDVYPDQVASQPELGGYQLMVAADIFRGRYRESLSVARPVAANQVLPYRFALPAANHVFLPGHRIMVQVQSSWFPLYDRNPQTFVPNIFFAEPKDYRKATQRVYHTPQYDSHIELPVAADR
ncbi:CocE/NonD family hydrolase [Oxalobacteraceae bacterium A2-2]